MKYEIIIEPENEQYCGKCNYKIKDSEMQLFGTAIDTWKCMLFGSELVSWHPLYRDDTPPFRCGECKLLTERFMKMPELDEAR